MLDNIWDWIIVILVALLLFGGASKVPQLARAFGRAVGEFKKGQLEVERELRNLQQGGQPEQGEDRQKKIAELERQLQRLKDEDSKGN